MCSAHVYSFTFHMVLLSSSQKDDADEPMCTEEIQPTAPVTPTPSVSSIQKDSSHMGRKQTGTFFTITACKITMLLSQQSYINEIPVVHFLCL